MIFFLNFITRSWSPCVQSHAFICGIPTKAQICNNAKFRQLIFNLVFCNYIYIWFMFILHIILNQAWTVFARLSSFHKEF